MEKRYLGIPQVVIETDDIEKLSQRACEELKCGDVVVKLTIESGNELRHAYQVSHKQATGLCLVYCDYETIEEIYYEKGSSGWAFGEKHVRSFDAEQAE